MKVKLRYLTLSQVSLLLLYPYLLDILFVARFRFEAPPLSSRKKLSQSAIGLKKPNRFCE